MSNIQYKKTYANLGRHPQLNRMYASNSVRQYHILNITEEKIRRKKHIKISLPPPEKVAITLGYLAGSLV